MTYLGYCRQLLRTNRLRANKPQGLALVLASCCVIVAASTFYLTAANAQTTEIDKGQAAEIAQAKFGGELFGKIKVLQADDGSTLFEVRLDTNGHVEIILVDAQGNAQPK